MTQAPLQLQPHNPDVLMCIANLSNDEVFTPPELVNQMLDTLADSWAAANNGASIWADKEVTFGSFFSVGLTGFWAPFLNAMHTAWPFF